MVIVNSSFVFVQDNLRRKIDLDSRGFYKKKSFFYPYIQNAIVRKFRKILLMICFDIPTNVWL